MSETASSDRSSRPPATRAVDIFLQYLKAEGVRHVFGIPGGLLHPFFEAVEKDPALELVVTRHEEGAAFMADGYARVSRCMAVCAGTSGPGATNLLTGVSVAFADGVPMLVVTGQAASLAMGKGAAQETPREDIDIVAMFQPVTKYSTMVTSAQVLSHHLRRALRLALSGRQAPVHLNIPVDIWEQPIQEEWFEPTSYHPSSHLFDRNAVQEASRHLLAARRPAILAGAGVGCAGAVEHLLNLAELLPARVATTPRGKGLFPEDHPLSLGVLGVAGHRAARAAILGEEVDVLFTVGASLNETSTYNWNPDLGRSRILIQCDIDVDRIGRNYPVDMALEGDAQTILVELVYHMHRCIREGEMPRSTWQQADPLPRGDARFMDPELRRSDSLPVTPQRWRRDLQEALPEDAVIFSDIGGHMLFNIHHLRLRRWQRFILNLGFGSMGHGTAAPVGAALAVPDRSVIAIVGDACFMMNGMELLTAVEHGVPVVWIVEHNNMHGIIWHGSRRLGKGRAMESSRFQTRVDIAAIAGAMGLSTWVVDAPGQIQAALDEALARRRPGLIEVRVDPDLAPPLGERARSLAGFISR